MKINGKSLLVGSLLIGLLAGAPASAWILDGQPICTEVGDQQALQLVADGAGGFFIVWQDSRNGQWDIYAQRRDKLGEPVWPFTELAVCTVSGDQIDPRAVADTDGGFFIVWTDGRSGLDIFGQRVHADGSVQWEPDGIPVSDAIRNQSQARIAADGHGGAVVVWTDTRRFVADIYGQRYDHQGNHAWVQGGVTVSAVDFDQISPELAVIIDSNPASTRVTVVWEDFRSSGTNGKDIYAQRMTLEGAVQWGPGGLPVTTGTDDDISPQVVAGLSGSSIIAWKNDPGSYWFSDIHLDRLDRYGVSQNWSNNLSGHAPRIASDGLGGVILGWNFTDWGDEETESRWRHFGQDGSIVATEYTLWHLYEWEVEDAGTRIVGDGQGIGGIGCFFEHYPNANNLNAKKIGPGNGPDWEGILGVPVCHWQGLNWGPEIIMLNEDNALVAWCDERDNNNTGTNIFAQRLANNDGAWGYFPPHIRQVADQPGDQGGAVILTLRASNKDIVDPISDAITGYNVWRRLDETAGAARADALVLAQLTDPAKAGGLQMDATQAARLGFPEGSWLSLGYHAAIQQAEYYFLASTVSDSSAAGIALETYVVTAHTPEPTLFYVSEPASGYSVDNSDPDNLSDAAVGFLPRLATLSQNRPNPFNPSTTISFEVARDCQVSLRIFDVAGRLILPLMSGESVAAGHHEMIWDGRDEGGNLMSSGTYYCSLEAGGARETKKMVLIK